MAITKAMLDAERERIKTSYEQVTYEGRVYTAGALEGFNRAVALIREHGVHHEVHGEVVVRVEIPAR